MSSAEVEVRLDDVGSGYFPAFVRDILDDGHVLVSFKNPTMKEQRLHFTRVRLPPEPTPGVPRFRPGMRVERFFSDDPNHRSYFAAVIQSVQRGMYEIKYEHGSVRGYVEAKRLRIANENPPIRSYTFRKIEVPVPYQVVQYLNTLSDEEKIEGSHREFQRLTGAASCRYIPEKRLLRLIYKNSDTVLRVKLFKEQYFRSLSQGTRLFLLPEKKEPVKQKEEPVEQEQKPRSWFECPICTDEETPDALFCATVPCGHVFHRGCIDTWFERPSKTCPFCRKETRDIINLYGIRKIGT